MINHYHIHFSALSYPNIAQTSYAPNVGGHDLRDVQSLILGLSDLGTADVDGWQAPRVSTGWRWHLVPLNVQEWLAD